MKILISAVAHGLLTVLVFCVMASLAEVSFNYKAMMVLFGITAMVNAVLIIALYLWEEFS